METETVGDKEKEDKEGEEEARGRESIVVLQTD